MAAKIAQEPRTEDRLGWEVWVVAALAIAVYSPTLAAPFHFDDFSLLTDPAVVLPDGPLGLLQPERTRPLAYLTFWLNYQIGGADPFGYHLLNIGLLAALAFAAASVYSRLAPRPAAFAALVFFVLHPLQSEPAAYVFGRATALATFFALLSWRSWIDGRWPRAVAWYAAALLAKEEAASLPVFLAGYEWVFRRADTERWSNAVRASLLMLLLGVATALRLIYAAAVTPGPGAGFELEATGPAGYLLTQGRVVWLYLRLVAAPWVGQTIDHDVPFVRELDVMTVVAWLAFALLVGAALQLMRKHREFYWLVGALILLAPSSSLFPLADAAAERRMFLPMASLALLFGAGFAYFGGRLGVRGVTAATITLSVALGALSWERSKVWSNEEALWREAVRQAPVKVRPRLQLARALEAHGDGARGERRQLLNDALALEPDNPTVASEMGVFYLAGGEPERALEAFEAARSLDPGEPRIQASIATTLYMMGRVEEAEQGFRETLQRDACNFDARNNLMLILRSRSDEDSARKLAREASPDCRFSEEQRRAFEAAAR